MSDLVKAQYRNADSKAEAYKLAEEALKLLTPAVMVKDDEALPAFCETAAVGIVSELAEDIVGNALRVVKSKGGTLGNEDIERVMRAMTELFVKEMRTAGQVAMMDLRLWHDKALAMGGNAEAVLTTLTAAWATNQPPLFTDLHQRIKQAVDGYFNSSLQTLILHGG